MRKLILISLTLAFLGGNLSELLAQTGKPALGA